MNRSASLVVVVMVLLAGCSILTDSRATDSPTIPPAAPTSTATQPATPTPIPTTSTSDASQELAPGITSEGIANPVSLMNAHQRELLADGFVVDQTVVSTYNDSINNRLVIRTTVGPGGEHSYQTATSTASDPNGTEIVITNDIWLNTTAQISRHIERGKTTYQVHQRLYSPESLVWFGTVQSDIQFAAGEYEVTNVERRDGLRFVTLSVSYDRVGGDGVDDAIGTLLVDERGVIHRARMNVSYDVGTVYSTTYEVVEIGDVEPEPPAWIDAVPPSAALTVGLDVFDFTREHVELVHTYGDPVPAGSIVTVVSNGTLYETRIEDPFRDGTRYLWLATNGTLRATPMPPAPDAALTLDTELTVTVRAPDGGELFSTSIGRR